MNDLNDGRLLGSMVARALTGRSLDLGSATSPATMVAELGAAGWGAAELIELRDRRHAAGEPWPFVVTSADRGTVGAAQLHSAVSAVLNELGVGSSTRLRNQHVPRSARDEALLADRPPHHGAVG